MKYLYLDTEFTPKNLSPTGLISIGLTTEEASYYAVNAAADLGEAVSGKNGPWMKENVVRHLPTHKISSLRFDHEDVKTYGTIRTEVDAFLKAAVPDGDRDRIMMIVNCGAQDVVRLHTLLANNDFGELSDWVPLFSDDIARIKRKAYALGVPKGFLPVQDPETEHHALRDAEHEMTVHNYLRGILDEER